MGKSIIVDEISQWQYFDELNPLYLNYICILNGRYPVQIDSGFNYCELGCGVGTTLNSLAELFPGGHFFGIDNNKEYIHSASAFAQEIGSSNIDFKDVNFDDLCNVNLPDFDYIIINNIYSWKDKVTRDCIKKFVGNHIKKVGIVFLNYETQPGSSSIISLRDMASFHTKGMVTDNLTKAQCGLDYLNFLAENNARVFAENAAANEFYDEIKTKDINYVAQRLFSSFFEPFYFHQIEKEMFEIGLSFAGSAICHLNFIDLAVPQEFQDFLKNVSSREQFETHGDLIRNQRYRKDLFVNGREVMDEIEQTEALSDLTFGLSCTEDNFETLAIFGDVELNYNNDVFKNLISILANSPNSVLGLQERAKLQNYSLELIIDALKFLTSNGQVTPVMKTASEKDIINLEADRYSICSNFNIQLLKNRLFKQDKITLISLKRGVGINMSMSDALFTLCLVEAGSDGVVDWVLQRLIEANQEILTNEVNETNTMKAGYEEFRKNRLPQLLQLEIIKPIVS